MVNDYPPGHQRPKEHGDEEAEGVAGHDEGAGGAPQLGWEISDTKMGAETKLLPAL